MPSGGRCAAEEPQGLDRTPAESTLPAPSAEPVSTSATANEVEKIDTPTPRPPLSAEERRARREQRLARQGLTRADISAVTWRLMERWPAVFGEHRRAVAVGIHHVILAAMADCDRAALSFALREWCSHPAYLQV